MRRAWPVLGFAVVVVACGARTPLATGGSDASVDAGIKDARTDAKKPDGGPCTCGDTRMNENETPFDNCVQGAGFIAFAVKTACDTPVGQIQVHTNAITLGLLASAGDAPGAVIVPPTTPQVPEPGWTSISPTGVTMLGGVTYYVIIGNDHKPPGVGCDYSDTGDLTDYWGGEIGNFDGPYYAAYVARIIAACK